MEFRQIRYALSVAKERSFTKAATRLNISQSAVSEQVRLLEDEIGFPLFRRTSRGIEVTERGRTFLYEAGRVVYGLSEHRLKQITGDHDENPTLDLPCRTVFAAGQRPVEVIGPMLEDEAAAQHDGVWGKATP